MISRDPRYLNTGLIGSSPAIREAAELIVTFAPTSMAVLVTGPTGAGKEMVARALHALSGRPGRLVAINCAAMPRELVEGNLFGNAKGAYTGATRSSDGLIVAASRGTLFLDELSSMPIEVQPKLLRVLETGEVLRLNESISRRVDFRTVAAVQEDGAKQKSEGRLREDLLYRLNGVVIRMPPLRERREDIVPLARYFAEPYDAQVTACGATSLRHHDWPGNVRELKHVVERAATLFSGTIDGRAVEAAMRLGGGIDNDPSTGTVCAEREHLVGLGRSVDWDLPRLVEVAGISRATLFRRLRQLKISVRAERRQAHADASRSVA